jgi:hypothetical protein
MIDMVRRSRLSRAFRKLPKVQLNVYSIPLSDKFFVGKDVDPAKFRLGSFPYRTGVLPISGELTGAAAQSLVRKYREAGVAR